MTIRVWKGFRCGQEEAVERFEFDGEELGSVREGTETRVKQTVVYRANDGRYVIHEVRRSLLHDEETARVCIFASLDEARMSFGWVLETIGLHPSRRAMLKTFEGYDY